ncbi:hypothetical protein [Acetobacterium bakii]|uniref:Uncharacterized protein n=1 Tax=Acetobacterium bakii TaxID=52689 RepID=A0A0L6U1P0_9FIRM|nr:hypothetical protein [Acetobacterium bakii]KNZ42421.1 hypothetical protein AKG39_06550 [Acetobacterium bakii]
MGRINEEYHRFLPLPLKNEELKIEVRDQDRWLFYWDSESDSVPYVVIEKNNQNQPQIKTTRDLMEREASLFSNEKMALIFMNKFKGE